MSKLKLVIPKGRIQKKILALLEEAGINIKIGDRAYRASLDDCDLDVKIMKPQNIPTLLELGCHDIGFTGLDWIKETKAHVVNLMDLGFDPVRIVAAVHRDTPKEKLEKGPVIVASEYEEIAKGYLDEKKINYQFLRTYGATEVFPPDDADMIIDNTSTGQTLKEHQLDIIDTVMKSSTCFIANEKVLKDPEKKERIDDLIMLFKATLDGRKRVIVEMNVTKDKLEEVIRMLPCMRAPTVSPLYGEEGFAVKTAVFHSEIRELLPKLKKFGATDILEYQLNKVVL